MSDIDNDFCLASRLTPHIIKLEVHSGINVSRESARQTLEQVVEIMEGDFGMLINRVNDYSIDPISIYSYLNTIEPLKAVAIVVHSEKYMELIPMQKRLLHVPLEGFLGVDEAYSWLQQVLNQS